MVAPSHRRRSGIGAASKDCRVLSEADHKHLSPERVVAAVRSLYADRLEPFGRILLRRIREQCAKALGRTEPGSVEDAPLIDPKVLRKVCMSCKELIVRPVEGKEISVLLKNHPADFVDVCSPSDPFALELWAEASFYFENLQGDNLLLPGGRYACAQALVARRLPFLQDLSLGEICHFVQLSVSQKRILGFTEGGMVPYRHSETSVKEQCAAVQQPFASTATWPVATWEQARACIASILHTAGGAEPGVITISNVKRLFRCRFGLDLSETALGHSRLTDLLQDPRLYDICKVEVRGTGHCVVCRSVEAPAGEGCRDLAWMPTEECGAGDWWSAGVWNPADGAVPVVQPEGACWDAWQPCIPNYYRADLSHGRPDLHSADVAAPPGFELPRSLLAAPPGLTMESWDEAQLEPMKVQVSDEMQSANSRWLPDFDKDFDQVAFLNFPCADPAAEAPRNIRQSRAQHFRSQSVSTNPGSEHIYSADSDCHETIGPLGSAESLAF